MVSNAKIDRHAKTLIQQTGIPLWLARKYATENATIDTNHPLWAVREKEIAEAKISAAFTSIIEDAKKEYGYLNLDVKFDEIEHLSDKLEYSHTIVNLAILYGKKNDWEKFAIICNHYNFSEAFDFIKNYGNYIEYKELLSTVIDTTFEQFIINNPTRESLLATVHILIKIQDVSVDYFWFLYETSMWAAFMKLQFSHEEITSFFAQLPSIAEYHIVSGEKNNCDIYFLCRRLLTHSFDTHLHNKNVPIQKIINIYQYIIDLYCSTIIKQQELITYISQSLSLLGANALQPPTKIDPLKLIPLLKFINHYQPELPNVNVGVIIANTNSPQETLDQLHNAFTFFSNEKIATQTLVNVLKIDRSIYGYISYFSEYTDISSVAKDVLALWEKEGEKERKKIEEVHGKTLHMGLLNDRKTSHNNYAHASSTNEPKHLTSFLTPHNYSYNLDILYCLAHYPDITPTINNLYENIYDQFPFIAFTGHHIEIKELLTALGELVTKTYNISVPLFISLMKTGRTPDGFYSNPTTAQEDKYIMDVYLALMEKAVTTTENVNCSKTTN